LILLDFLKMTGARTTLFFPHLRALGKPCGSSFSPSCGLLQPRRQKGLFGELVIGLLVGFLTASSHAEMPTVEQQINQAVQQHLQQMMDKQANANHWQGMRLILDNTPLSSTRQLVPCANAINVSGGSSTKFTRQQLTLECAGTQGWPIKVSSDMQVFLPVIISTSIINRGDTIQANQLQRQEQDITRSLRGFYHRIDQVAGMGAKRRIRANQLISPDLIDQPQLVRRGEKVKIVAMRDGISAAMSGEALEKGGEGEVIRVKNLSSGKTIQAKVIEAGVVTSTF
jgi:flagellar basal body P-ring formation protein FlgA